MTGIGNVTLAPCRSPLLVTGSQAATARLVPTGSAALPLSAAPLSDPCALRILEHAR